MIDQLSKIIVHHYFLDLKFDIIPNLFEFYPVYNTKYSYLINILLGLDMPLYIFIIYIFLIQCIMFFYFFKKAEQSKLYIVLFIFFEAGHCCALITYFFWSRGCLDFIYLKPLFIFDFKDLYNSIFGILLFFYLSKIVNKRLSKYN